MIKNLDLAAIRSSLASAVEKGAVRFENGSPPAPPPRRPLEKPVTMNDMVDFDYSVINQSLGLALNRTLSPMRMSLAISLRLQAMTPDERERIPEIVREMVDALRATILSADPFLRREMVPVQVFHVTGSAAVVKPVTMGKFADMMASLEQSLGWSSFRAVLGRCDTVENGAIMLSGGVVRGAWNRDAETGKTPGTTLKIILESLQRHVASRRCGIQDLIEAAT